MSTTDQEIQNLLQAINALYHHTDPKVKEQASKWLEDWQQTPQAWQISDALLHSTNDNLELQYFCASTLKIKVQRDFEELPRDAAFQLRNSVMNLLLKFARGTFSVRTQLCLALAAVAAHLPAADWGSRGVVGWLADTLESQPKEVALPCMLEMLTILPQEAGSYRPAIRPERRRQLFDEIKAQGPAAINILSTCNASAGEYTEKVLEAFAAWLKLGGAQGLAGAELASHPLVAATLQGLNTTEQFDGSVEAVVELIGCTTANGHVQQHMMPLAEVLVAKVMSLRPRFSVMAQRFQAEKEGRNEDEPGSDFDDNEDTAKGMARLFSEIGEAFVELIATGSPQLLEVVDALLEVAAFPDDSICAISFNFWMKLAHQLTSAFTPQPIQGSTSAAAPISPEDQVRRVALFTGRFERLVELIRGRVSYPPGYDSWHRDERADFKRARYAIGDTLVDAAKVLGPQRTMSLLVVPLQQISAQIAAGGHFDWRKAEAGLYCIRAVHRMAPPAGDPLLLSLFSSLPHLPDNEPKLQYTVALTISSYSDWFAECIRGGAGGELVTQTLQLLAKGLSNSETCAASALALRNLCDACRSLLGPQLNLLMTMYIQLQAAGNAPVTSPPSTLPVDEDDIQQVMEGVCLVVSRLSPQDRSQGATALLTPLLTPLQGLLAGPTRPMANGHSDALQDEIDRVMYTVDRITVVFRYLDEPATIAASLTQVWPLLEAITERYGADVKAAERICRCIRYAVRTAGKEGASLLPLLQDSLPNRFTATRHSCYLYVASELIKIFGDDPQRDSGLGIMFDRLMRGACSSLTTLSQFDALPDLADDTFILAGRALHYCPRVIITPQLLPCLLDAAITGLLVQHREACLSIITFLIRLLQPEMLSKCPPVCAECLSSSFSPRAPLLLREVMAAIAGALPTSREKDLAALITTLLQATRQQGYDWLAATVALIPESCATVDDRNKFIGTAARVAADQDGSGAMEGAVQELSDVIRRNRRCREAAQKVLLPEQLHHIIR